MKKALIIIALLWIALIGGIIGIKEYTLQTGQEVLLKTVPVDPRDLFRGDYVILSYDISTLDSNRFGISEHSFAIGQKIFVSLRKEGDYFVADQVDLVRPTPDKLFIAGKVRSISGKRLMIEYGIESYFVPEGKGRELERVRGRTLDVLASVDKRGNVVIKSVLIEGKVVNFSAEIS